MSDYKIPMSDRLRAEYRVRHSDASGISHYEIYGYSVEKDLAVLGRHFLEIIPERMTDAEWQSFKKQIKENQ